MKLEGGAWTKGAELQEEQGDQGGDAIDLETLVHPQKLHENREGRETRAKDIDLPYLAPRGAISSCVGPWHRKNEGETQWKLDYHVWID